MAPCAARAFAGNGIALDLLILAALIANEVEAGLAINIVGVGDVEVVVIVSVVVLLRRLWRGASSRRAVEVLRAPLIVCADEPCESVIISISPAAMLSLRGVAPTLWPHSAHLHTFDRHLAWYLFPSNKDHPLCVFLCSLQ